MSPDKMIRMANQIASISHAGTGITRKMMIRMIKISTRALGNSSR